MSTAPTKTRVALISEDAKIRERMEQNREEMAALRAQRARMLLAARESGMTVQEIADKLRVHVDIVYKLIREARRDLGELPTPDDGRTKRRRRKGARG